MSQPTPLILLKASGYTSGVWIDEGLNANGPNAKNATLENGTATLNSDGNGIVLNGQTSWTFPNIEAGEQWTVNIWYKQLLLSGGMIVTQLDDGGTFNMAIGSFALDGSISSGHYNTNLVKDSENTYLVQGAWYNIQVVSDGNQFTTYINGESHHTSTSGPAVAGTSAYVIGRSSNYTYVTGEIGELRIYNTALTQAQVTADYEDSVATFPNPPMPITEINFSNITTSSFEVSWEGGYAATSYTYTLNGTPTLPSVDNGMNKNAVFSGLTPKTEYTLIITATNDNDSITSSPASTTTTDPLKPYGFTTTASSQTSFTISWQGGIGATSYSYNFTKSDLVPIITNNGVASKSATFAGLSPNFTYILNVIATNANDSVSSDSYTAFTDVVPLAPPTIPVVSTSMITPSSFKATWTGGNLATSYSYGLDGFSIDPAVNSVSGKYAIFSGLAPSTTYALVVTAVNVDGATSSEEVSITTLERPPSNVLLLKAADYTSGAWQDQSSSANNAILESGTATKNAAGNGLILNGSTSWSFPNLNLGNSWTVGVWYKETEAVNGACIIAQKGGAPAGSASLGGGSPPVVTNVSIGDNNANGTITAGFYNGGWYTGDTVTLNGWTNIQATWDGIKLKTHVNGIALPTYQPDYTPLASSLSYRIGGNYAGSAFVKGEIGEVRIYNYALTGQQVTADYNASYNTFATPVAGAAPTPIADLAANTITGNSFGISWTGGFGATSYTYTLNGSFVTPSMNRGLTSQTAVFTGLIPSTNYNISVKAINTNGDAKNQIDLTTLLPPPPVTVAAVAAVQETFALVSTAAEGVAAIQAALAQNVAPQTLVAAALAVNTPTMFTALVTNPSFIGRTVSVPAAAAAVLYAAFSPVVTVDTTLPLVVTFPAADGSVVPPANGSNTKLAIDLTRDTYVPFSGATGYGIDVRGGVQYFVTPTNTAGTLVNVGDTITFVRNGGANATFVVADLDIVLTPATPVICFLGSAPVLTPSGYKCIDTLQIGDIVNTTRGTATIEAIKKQSYTPGPNTNPYVIPEGKFGANCKLHISPRHKVAIRGKMIEARDLGLQQEVQTSPIIYYNIQITKGQNMIVAGVEVESLQELVRITISREAFNHILATQYGGVLTDEIKSKCQLLPDGRVIVPSVRR